MSETPSYLDARAELTRIIGKLESGGQSLEDSLALWERGEYLADVCQEWLTGAAARVEERIAAAEADDDDDEA
jgi:exodeoxyribonuclease VII small subunit